MTGNSQVQPTVLRSEQKHPVTYRRDVVSGLLSYIGTGESAVLVAPASMGKSNLIQFLGRKDVIAHHLGSQGTELLIVWIDCNRLVEYSTWGLFELILSGLLDRIEDEAQRQPLWEEYEQRYHSVILQGNPVLALRTVERLVRNLIQKYGYSICILLDEFDDAYQTLPGQALASLRALRDANKYDLCYLVSVRDHLSYLRDPDECEGLYEQFSRNVVYLGPLGVDDTRNQIERWLQRWNLSEQYGTKENIELIRALCGGHPGLLIALMSGLRDSDRLIENIKTWATGYEKVHEECRKIYEGLHVRERLALLYIANGASVSHTEWESLVLKGLVQKEDNELTIFSPLLQSYLASQALPSDEGLFIDKPAGIVVVNGERVIGLNGLPYELLVYLYDRSGEVRTREEIVGELYGDDSVDPTDNRLDALVTRLRRKIESDPKSPRYLKTVRGKGFRLVCHPETE